ncbi:class I SAM-dependent methyltransferase [Streptomyces coeruleorubidus]|uniref:class I SAM-dependent methyltransferase n=1 Tax=Streptomyces coeruleorubidus TaxID=116188 RepID=UPI0036BF4039
MAAPVPFMSGAAVTVVQAVGVILVRHGDVAAPLTVLVVVGGMTGSGALVDMAAVDPVDVAVAREGDVAATLASSVQRALQEVSSPALAGKVLDACCGTGASVLPAARAVGAGGLVDAVDPSGALVALGERRARQEGLADLRFHQHDVTAWAARADGYDLVQCALGVIVNEMVVTYGAAPAGAACSARPTPQAAEPTPSSASQPTSA